MKRELAKIREIGINMKMKGKSLAFIEMNLVINYSHEQIQHFHLLNEMRAIK